MSLEDIYFIGQTVSAAAVVGSLLAVAYQLREANRTSRLARHYEFIEASMRAYEPIYGADAGDILRRGMADPGQLNLREEFVFNILMGRIMMVAIHIMLGLKSGAVTQNDADAWALPWYQQVSQSPGGRKWFADNRHLKEAVELAKQFDIDLAPAPEEQQAETGG